MKVNRKFLRSAERLSLSAIAKDSAAQKIVSAVTAIGFVMQPVAALASTITRTDGGPNVSFNNGVADVFAGKVVGDVAINKFAEFKLDANNIANMYFVDSENKSAGNLVNFVNSRIDINGTVNAIQQNKKIGGNLFFFSSDGMAVGKSGVINAGALYVATPTKTVFDDYKKLDTEDNFNTIIKDEGFAKIPINASGTISVLGKVNAVNAVNLRAAKIGVGKNVSGEAFDNVDAGATVTGASIRTGVVDFKNIVNIGNVKSGLSGTALTAEKTGSGDIVLAAYNNYNDNYSVLDDFSKIAGESVNAELSVANGAEVNAAGKAKLSAKALNNVVVEKSDQYKENYTPSTTTNSHLYGQIVTTNATVNVNGNVEAQQVDINADAVNRYVSAESSVLNMHNITSNIMGALTGNVDASYAVLKSMAEVNVGRNAEINAKGSDTKIVDSDGKEVIQPALNIQANSRMEAGAGASTALLKAMNVGGTNIIPAAAVTYSKTHNEAAVKIYGELKSKGGTSVTALADSKVNSEAKATTMDVSENPNTLNVALNITTGDNKSSVTIGENAKMTELQKDVKIEAKSQNSVLTKAEVSTGEKAVIATAINVTDYDSKANVNINGNVSSKDGSLAINAENVLTDNTVIANNAMGSSSFMKGLVTNIKGSQTVDSFIGENGVKDKLLGGITKWLANAKYTPQKLKDKLNAPSTPSTPSQPKPWDKLADFMEAGVSVGVAVESNTADVKIGQGVALTAKDDLNITAKSVIEDTQMQITGKSNNYDEAVNNNALVNASVLYSKLDNTATVTVAGGEAAQNPDNATNVTLTGGKVNIAANSSFEYNRINRMVQEVKDACAKVKAAYKGDNHDDIYAKADALEEAAEAFFTYARDNCLSSTGEQQVDFMDLFGGQKYKDFTAACSALTSALGDEAKNIAVGPINVVGAATAFANPNSYLNFSAGSANGGKSGPGEHEKPATIALAGSAVATDISNNARVLIGKNANIKAGNELAMQAASKQFDVSLAGKLGLNGGGKNAAGGTFAIGLADANSLVAVAQGAKLTAGSIDIGTENKIDHIQLSLGAGKGTTSGVSGMVGYLEGASNSLVSVDDEAVINAGTGAVNLNAKNDTNVYSAAGAVAMGETAGIGAAATITNFDRYTYAAIGDNGYTAPPQATTEQGESGSDSGDKLGEDANADRSKEAEKLANTADKKHATLQQLVQNASGLRQDTDNNEQEAFFGSKTAEGTKKGSIDAGSFNVNAETGGKIINVAVAGGVSTGDDSGEAGIFDKLGNFVSNKTNALTNKLHALDHKVAGKINGLMDRQTEAQKVLPTDQTPKATTPGKQSSVTIAGAGSAAINLLDGDTGALVDNVKINIAKDATNGKTITVTAKDTAMMVAAGGAAGISWKKLTKDNNANSHNAAFGGTVAVNDIDSQTLAVISNSEIENAAAIINNAQKSGSLAAAGLGLALAKNSGGNGGTNIVATVNASVNIADNTAYALLQNNKVNNENVSGEDKLATSITNTAFDNDIQITGGVNTSLSIGGDNAFVGGATVAYGSLKNDVQAAILGGTYDKITTADVKATTNMTQVGVAANVSVAGGAKTSYAFSGNSAYNKLDNYANATVEGVTLTGESLNVAAYDTAESANTQAEYLKKRGLDADGSAYLAQVKEAADESGDSDEPTKVDTTRRGNVIVTGAVSVGVTTGNDGGSATASVTVSDIDNDYNAKIKDSNITATGKGSGDALVGTNVNAASHTVLAGFAAGVAGTAGSFGVGGSANWQSLNNDITAAVENSKLITPKADVKTESGALAVNVAGQIGVTTGKNSKLGAGLAVAYNSLNNTTGAYVKGSEISGAKDANSILTVDAANKGNVYSVGAAVTAGTAEAALNGVVVVNKGKNDVEAVIDKYDGEKAQTTDRRTKLNNMGKVAVKSSDDSNQLAVIGNVSVAAGKSAKAAIGGSVAINDIGALAGGKQSNRAAINNADITTAKDGKISVNAVDESTLTTISAGVAITSGNFAFSGGGSAALIEKETKTELKNTNVNADDAAKGDVEASAKGTARITTVGVMGAGAKNAAAGFGIAVNKINADTETEIEGGTYKTDNFIAKSDSVAELTSIGISAAAAKNAGVAGNVTVNLIGNDTATKINNATIIANNNIAALATSSETLHNYAGAMGVAAGGQAGIGMSVAYNEITGNTESVVENSTLQASGTAALGEDVSKKHKDSKGIVVAADAEHELNNVIVTAGLAASSDAAVAVSGTVAVNHLDGATTAKINNTAANTSGTAGDVSVLAKDKTKVISAVGAASVAVGADAGVGFGAASDTNLLSRNVTAEIDGGDAKKAFNADKLTVDAQSENKTSTTAVGAAVAAAAYGAAGVAGTVSVTKTDAVTLAKVNNITGYNKGTTINAHRSNDITLVGSSLAVAGGMGAGAGGISVGVLSDDSRTEAQLTNASIKHYTYDKAQDIIHADNSTNVTTGIAAASAAIAIGGAAAGSVGVNNFNNTVKTSVANSSIENADTITADANNHLTTNFVTVSAAGGLVGGSLGVGVNTIDTSVVTEVDNSTMSANNVTVAADETRDIKQTAANAAVGGVALGANVLVTNIGSAVQGTYTTSNNDSIDVDGTNGNNKHYAMADADEAIGEQNSINSGAYNQFVKQYQSEGSSAVKGLEAAGRGGNAEAKGVQVIIDKGSIVNASNKADIKANTTTNTNITAGGATVGAVSATGTFSILDVKRNSGVAVKNSSISAKEIAIASKQAGTADMNIYQGTGGMVGLNVAVGIAKLNGANKVELDGATLNNADKIEVKAEDESKVNANALGVAVGAVTLGSITAIAENESTNDIVVAKSDVKAATIDITADKRNTVTAHAMGGSAGMATGSAVVADATDNGTSNITLGKANDTAKKNTFSANTLNVNAKASPAVKAVADSVAVALTYGASAAVATATANGGANVTVNNGDELLVDKANLQADIYAQDGMKNAEAKAEGNSGSGLINVGANVATAKSNASANVSVGAIKGKTGKVVTGQKTVYDKYGTATVTKTTKTVGVTALNISSNNSTTAFADARGVNIGGVFSSGNNVAKTNNTSATNAVLNAGNDELLLGSLNVTASGAGDNLTTADGSGGGLVSTDLAAYAENRMNANTTTTVKGKLNVNGEVKINALQNDRANLLADALKATVIGASATKASNEIKGETKVNTDGLTLTGANNLTINANNTVTVGDSEKYAVKGSGYGGVNVQGAVLDNKIDKKAAINLGSAKITTAGAQDYEAETDVDANVGGYIKAAGAGAFTWVDVNNEVKAEDSIAVGSGAKLKTTKADKDITLAAVDNMTINVIGVADTQGAAIGGASSDVTNETTRNNSITVAGNAALYSMNDVNLYAGSDINGAAGKLKLNVDSEAYNKTALGLGKPKLKDDILQNNNVTLNNDSNISSVRNINLYADAGTETIRDTSVMYNWYYSDKNENYTSSTIGDNEPQNKHSNNYIQADGTLTAGVQNKQFITIGKDGALVFLDSAVRDGVNKVSGNNAIGESELRNQITASDGINKDEIVIGTMDYGTTLFERYEQVRKLMNEYSEDTNSTAYLGYKAELQRITGELQTMGLIEEIKDSNGNVYYAPIKGATIDYISLPDIVASGGNINITTDTLAGSGTMEAKGAPEVTVTNNTNLYMKINNITVGDAGGEINYNGVGLKSNDYNTTINELNIDKAKSAQFGKVTPTAEAGTGGTITVNGNYGGNHVQAKVTDDNGKEQTIETKPKADIEINGYVNAKKGIVNINSRANNIIIQGASADSSAGVSGKEVHLTAASGSVSQGYTDGITNIGGSVQDQYQSKYDALKKEFDDKYGYEHTENISGEVKTSTKANDRTGNMIVGENIYINASDININGYMQSGYADYYVTVDDGIAATINSIKNSYKGGSLSDAVVTTGTKYRVVTGKDVWDEATKSYKRQLDVYYNPATGKLVVPDVDVNGGKIYLTGRISSTGGGTIKALDGAYNVAVTNNTANTLQLGRLVSNKSEGLISITDTGRRTLTEITRSGAKEYAISDINKLHETNVSTSEYKPQEGLRYNWTTGKTVSTSKTYQNTVKAGLWGLVETMDDTKLTEFEQHNKPIKESDSTEKYKPNGEYIGKINNSTVNSSDFSVIYDNKVLENSKTGPGEPERWSSGFLGWFKWERYTWTRHTGTSQQYVASVKADKTINIGFIGHDNGNINVNSNGSVDIKGKLASTAGGSINLTSNNGSITQNGVNMVSDNVNLIAQTGINNIGITSIGDTVNLSAANHKSGDIDITVAGAYGKAGNVLVASIVNSGNDEIHLTADGNINQSGNDASIIGKRIDLSSINGAIGNSGKLQIKSGTEVVDATDSLSASINANAKGNINLTQTEGDMRVGQIKSEQGNVTINVTEGNVVDALPDGEIIDRGDTDALIQKWKDLGLISGEGSYTAKQKQDVDEYKQQVTDEFKQYKDLDAYYQKNELTDAEKASYESYKNAKTSYDSLTQEFKDYQNQSIYYTDDKNIPQKAGYKTDADYQKALEAYNTGKTAYAALKAKCAGSANAEAYARSNMSDDSWNSYNAPQVGDKNMKASFGSYDSYQDLQARYNGYTDADAYLQSDTAKQHISELTDASRSWTENQLLYAIQDSIINPSSDSGDNISKAPNIIGQSITINAAKGSVGLDSDTVEVINLAGISDRVDDLKKLVNASASTVKWDKAAGIATITPKNPLGMQLTSANGKLSVNATENVYITNRKDATDNPLNIDTIKTDGNVRLQSNNGIYNLHNGEGAAISGKDLLLQAGTGGVGKADKLLTINNNGKVTATGTNGVYLEQVGDNALQIVSVAAKGDIVLKAKGDIISADEEDTTAQGYINNESNNGTITIEAGGSAGSAEHKLRIKNADDNHTDKGISVTAGKDVYLQGISTTIAENAEANGTMFINGITAKGIVDVAANGNLNVKGAVNNNASGNVTMTAEKSIAVNAAITNADANIILSARNNVNLNENAVLQAKKVNLVASAVRNPGENAATGSITQNANSRIIADKVVASALNGIDLSSVTNTLKAIDVANMGQGAINIANDGTNNLTVVIAHKNNGDVTVHNYQNGNITSNMKVESQVEAEGAVNYINDAGSITLPDVETFTSEAEKFGTLKTYSNVINNVKRTTKAKKIVNIQAKNGDVINSGDIDSDQAVVIKTETGSGNITNTGNIRGTDVSLITENGDITSDGTLNSTSGDVTANTGKGNIELNADITSARDMLLTTADGSIITRGIINANRDVKANATTGFTSEKGINATTGDVELITQTGDINTKGDVTAEAGKAVLNSKGGNITNTGDIEGTDVSLITENGNIKSDGTLNSTSGDVTANVVKGTGNIELNADITSKRDVLLTTGDGSIMTSGQVKAQKNVDYNAKGSITTGDIINSTAGNINLQTNAAEGNITFGGNVTAADGNINIDVLQNGSVKDPNHKYKFTATSADGDINSGNFKLQIKGAGDVDLNEIFATNDATIDVTNGNITTSGDVTAETGKAVLNSKSGSVTMQNVAAGQVVDIDAAYDITADGNLISNNSDITLDAGGKITTNGTVNALNNVIANANGNINTNGDVTATNGNAVLNSKGGNVNTGKITAKNEVDIDAAIDITVGGNLISNNGEITLDAGGSITTNSIVNALNNVIAHAKGNIATNGDVTATNGNAVLNSKGGSVTMQNVTANNEVDIDAANNITANGSLTSTNANVDLNAGGSITTNGQVTAQKNVDYNAKGSITTGGIINSTTGNINLQTDAAQGDIIFGGDVTAEHGNINIDVLQNGNVTDDDNKFTALGDKGDINSGNFALQIKGAGDVDLHEIYATNNATINVANGNLTLAKIDGNLVALQLKTEGKQLKVDELIAGAKIIAQGSDIDLNKIQQRLDADGLLTIVPDGAQLNKPIDNLKIGEIITNKGVRFEHLWLNNGSIKVSEGMFHIDKLVVNNVAHFSNKHMKTAVWGAPPQRDGSDSVYWNNIAVNNPADNLTEWQQEGTNPDKWMFLHFTAQPNVQHSNGALLDLRNYDYVYDQRFTAVDHMLQQLNENKAEEYDINHAPDVVQYFRYDLYDLDEDDNKSEPVKITVEA